MDPPGRLREREQRDDVKSCNWLMCVCPPSFLCNSIRHLDLTLSGNYIITLRSGRWWPSGVLALILFHFFFKWIFLCSQRLRKVQDSDTVIISGSSRHLLYCELAAHEAPDLFAKTKQQIKDWGYYSAHFWSRSCILSLYTDLKSTEKKIETITLCPFNDIVYQSERRYSNYRRFLHFIFCSLFYDCPWKCSYWSYFK